MIDWETHWGAIASDLELALKIRNLAPTAQTDRHHRGMMTVFKPVVMRLRSRHIPDTIREQNPRLPWNSLGSFLATYDWWRDRDEEVWPPDLQWQQAERLMLSMIDSDVPVWLEEIAEIRAKMEGSDMDGNLRDGILSIDEHGPVAHVSVRVPVDKIPGLREFLAAAHADIPPLTLADVKRICTEMDEQLRELGITGLWVYGSVARDKAAPMSDIDMMYSGPDDSQAWRIWDQMLDLLEGRLGRVIDLHQHDYEQVGRLEAVRVWGDHE